MCKEAAIKTRLMNTEMEQQKGTQIIEREEMAGTPFTLVTTEGKTFLTMGKYQISEPMEKEEIGQYMMENEWNIITTIIGIISQHVVDRTEIMKRTPVIGKIGHEKE